jgi:chromosome segregation ATPase
MNLVQMADSIHKLQDKFQGLQREILDISRRKSAGQEELKNLHDEISNTKEKLDLVKKTFNTKYEELKEACSRVQRLQGYVEQFKEGRNYQEFETTVRNEVGGILSDNKKLLQNALFSDSAHRSLLYKYRKSKFFTSSGRNMKIPHNL